jgi:hypothetical protein
MMSLLTTLFLALAFSSPNISGSVIHWSQGVLDVGDIVGWTVSGSAESPRLEAYRIEIRLDTQLVGQWYWAGLDNQVWSYDGAALVQHASSHSLQVVVYRWNLIRGGWSVDGEDFLVVKCNR